jgi:hypothetical protein
MARTSTTEAVAGTPVTVVDVARPTLPPEDYLREQEKGETDPAPEAVEAVKAEPVTIGKNEPYPTGGAK